LAVNRNRRLLLVACLVGLATAALLWLNLPSGPTYRGRGVEAWLKLREDLSVNWGSQFSVNVQPEVLAAFRAMGDPAVPQLVEIAFRPPPGEGRRRAHKWLCDRAPWIEEKLPERIRQWLDSGRWVPDIAVAAVSSLRPPATVLFPALTNRLSAPESWIRFRAVTMLSAVSDQRQTAAHLLSPFVSAGEPHVMEAVISLGEGGIVLLPQLMMCLSTSNKAAVDAVYCLGQLGPPASAAVPALRKLFEQEAKPIRRLRIAISVANIQPQDWAIAEARAALTGTHQDLLECALNHLGAATNAASQFVPELLGVVRRPPSTPHVLNMALDALKHGTPNDQQVAQALEHCLSSTNSAVETLAAVRLLERDASHTQALTCLSKVVADPDLWHWRYHPTTPKRLSECLARIGPRGAAVLAVLREQAKGHHREWEIDEALKSASRRR
jgi:hypothetical protein